MRTASGIRRRVALSDATAIRDIAKPLEKPACSKPQFLSQVQVATGCLTAETKLLHTLKAGGNRSVQELRQTWLQHA